MKTVIQVSVRDCAKAWGILVRHSPGMALPDRKFIISEEALRALKKSGVKFQEISREGMLAGEVAGEII